MRLLSSWSYEEAGTRKLEWIQEANLRLLRDPCTLPKWDSLSTAVSFHRKGSGSLTNATRTTSLTTPALPALPHLITFVVGKSQISEIQHPLLYRVSSLLFSSLSPCLAPFSALSWLVCWSWPPTAQEHLQAVSLYWMLIWITFLPWCQEGRHTTKSRNWPMNEWR